MTKSTAHALELKTAREAFEEIYKSALHQSEASELTRRSRDAYVQSYSGVEEPRGSKQEAEAEFEDLAYQHQRLVLETLGVSIHLARQYHDLLRRHLESSRGS